MSDYLYLDIQIKLERPLTGLSREKIVEAIHKSLTTLFGDFGGAIELDVLKCDLQRYRLILRVPKEFYVKLRAALTFLSVIQKERCHFLVRKSSPVLLSLVESYLEF